MAVRNDRFGEFLLNIPALRALKETFPAAKITLVVGEGVKDLAEGLSIADKVLEWDAKKRHGLLERINFIRLLRKQRFDLAVILNPSKVFHVFSYLAGIPLRLGYGRKCGCCLTHKIKDLKHLGQKHEVDYNLELVSLADAQTRNKALSIVLREKDKIFIDNLLKKHNITETSKLVALHPFTSDPLKQWPIEKFKALTRRLISELLVKVIIIGGKEEEAANASFALLSPEVIDLTGKTTLLESAALLKKMRLLISNDSGPVHLARAVSIPVLAIFRNDLPGKNARRWGPWGEGNIVIEKSDLEQISVDEVFTAARSLLK